MNWTRIAADERTGGRRGAGGRGRWPARSRCTGAAASSSPPTTSARMPTPCSPTASWRMAASSARCTRRASTSAPARRCARRPRWTWRRIRSRWRAKTCWSGSAPTSASTASEQRRSRPQRWRHRRHRRRRPGRRRWRRTRCASAATSAASCCWAGSRTRRTNGRRCPRSPVAPPRSRALGVLAADAYERHGIELAPGRRGRRARPGACAGSSSPTAQRRAYRHAACSPPAAAPGCFPACGRDRRGVHYLRDLADARRLRSALARGRAGGRHRRRLPRARAGLVRAPARRIGRRARRLRRGCSRRFMPADCSDWLARSASRAPACGLHLGAELNRSSQGPPRWPAASRSRPRRGATFEADVVVVAIGLAPKTPLAQTARARPSTPPTAASGSMLRAAPVHPTGLRRPATARASHCAGRRRPTCAYESWQNANEQARAAAAGMLGQEPPTTPAYPWFWTDQFGCNLQMLGLPAPASGTSLAAIRAAAARRRSGSGTAPAYPCTPSPSTPAATCARCGCCSSAASRSTRPRSPTPAQPLRGQVKAAQANAAPAAGSGTAS